MPRRVRRSRPTLRKPRRNDLGQSLPAVLLEEVAATLDGGVRLSRRARDPFTEVAIRSGRDRVPVAEGAQHRTFEALEFLPRHPVGRCLRILR